MPKSFRLGTETAGTVNSALSSGTETAMIVELTGSFRQLVYQTFFRAGMSKEEVTLKVEGTKINMVLCIVYTARQQVLS